MLFYQLVYSLLLKPKSLVWQHFICRFWMKLVLFKLIWAYINYIFGQHFLWRLHCFNVEIFHIYLNFVFWCCEKVRLGHTFGCRVLEIGYIHFGVETFIYTFLGHIYYLNTMLFSHFWIWKYSSSVVRNSLNHRVII